MTDQSVTAGLDLDALEALANAAAPGPWVKDDVAGGSCRVYNDHDFVIYDEGGHGPGDAAFIAATRTAVPALIAEVRRLRKQLALAETITLGDEG